MFRWHPMTAVVGVAVGCVLASSCGKDTPTSPVTVENVVGTWYAKQVDAASGMTVMLYLDCRTDGTARIGLMNGASLVELLNAGYSIANQQFVFTMPPVDTASQNTLQIMFADAMHGIVAADRAYLQGGNLVFVEAETYTFSRSMPSVPGGRITGSVSVTNGTFGQGGVVIAAVNVNTSAVAGTFLSGTGPYTLWGLSNGQYVALAVYIPKGHALDWSSHNPTDFPSQMTTSPITVSNNGTVANTNFTIDLSTGLPNTNAAFKAVVSQALRALGR